MAGSPEAIRALVEPPLLSSGMELWDVEVSRDTVRVLVDRPGGVDLESLAALAGKVVSPLLDEHPELTPEGHFSLEVSSPGVERPLKRLAHYLRYIGTEVSVKTTVPVEGARRHQGTLLSADGDGIVLAPRDAPDDYRLAIRHDHIDRARTVLVWGPAEKPVGKKPVGKKPVGKKPVGKKPGANTGRSSRQETNGTQSPAVKRPAAAGPERAAQPVASREKETE